MANNKVTTETFDAHTVDIYVSPRGEFSGTLNGHDYTAPTLAALQKKLTAAVRTAAVRVAVPAMRLVKRYGAGPAEKIEAVTLTGIHASNKNVLVKCADGKTEQDTSYGATFLRQLDAAEVKQFQTLRDKYEDARTAYDDFISTRTVRPKDLLRAAFKDKGIEREQVNEMLGER
jgi:hypothetical protein